MKSKIFDIGFLKAAKNLYLNHLRAGIKYVVFWHFVTS